MNPGKPGRRRALMLAALAAVVAADQVSKVAAVAGLEGRGRIVIAGPLGLRLVRNSGGAFGVLQGAPTFFFAASIAVVAAVLWWGWKSGGHPVALGIVAGGGLGNVVDRLVRAPGPLRGHVVDFIDFGFWPTFNLADSAIVVGALLLVLAGLRAPQTPAGGGPETGGRGAGS